MGDLQGLSSPASDIVGKKDRETDLENDSDTKRAMLGDSINGGNRDHGPDIMRRWRIDVIWIFGDIIWQV